MWSCGQLDTDILLCLQLESVGSSAPFKFQILQSALSDACTMHVHGLRLFSHVMALPCVKNELKYKYCRKNVLKYTI